MIFLSLGNDFYEEGVAQITSDYPDQFIGRFLPAEQPGTIGIMV